MDHSLPWSNGLGRNLECSNRDLPHSRDKPAILFSLHWQGRIFHLHIWEDFRDMSRQEIERINFTFSFHCIEKEMILISSVLPGI